MRNNHYLDIQNTHSAQSTITAYIIKKKWPMLQKYDHGKLVINLINYHF